MTEARIQDAFAHWLKSNRIAFIQARRDKKSTIKAGAQDFLLYHCNRCLLIETKTAVGKLSPAQIQHAEEMRQHSGMIVHVCRSVEECVRTAQEWLGTIDKPSGSVTTAETAHMFTGEEFARAARSSTFFADVREDMKTPVAGKLVNWQGLNLIETTDANGKQEARPATAAEIAAGRQLP